MPASLISAYYMPVPMPDIAKCPSGSQLSPVENHCYKTMHSTPQASLKSHGKGLFSQFSFRVRGPYIPQTTFEHFGYIVKVLEQLSSS